jgi:hypothetical protein
MPKFSDHGRGAFTIPQGGRPQIPGTRTLLGALECPRGICGSGLREEMREASLSGLFFCFLVLEI